MAGVNKQHKDFDRMAARWKRVRDVVEGQDALHQAGEVYLPKLKDETDPDYKARLGRSDFFNATWRTISALSGMAFRRSPTVKVAAAIEPMLDDINLAGMSLEGLAKETVNETLGLGRFGLMVDHPGLPVDIATLSAIQAQERGLRPTIQFYAAESIINWKYGRVANAWVLIQVRLKECVAIPNGEFDEKSEDRFRVLDLDESGFYRQRLFKINDKGEDEQIGEDIYPMIRGAKMTALPFGIFGPTGRAECVDAPPLIDLVDKNVAHYQVNADYRHGAHLTGLPTLFLAGVQLEPGKGIKIGGSAAVTSNDPNAKASYIEFTGQGLGALEKQLDRLEKQMALLGARMLADESNQAETLGGTQIKRMGENAALASIVVAVSEAIEWALQLLSDWAGVSGEVEFEINRDFIPTMLDPQSLTAIFAGVQSGQISDQEAFALLQRGDVIAPDKTYAAHQAEIEIGGAGTNPPRPTVPVIPPANPAEAPGAGA